MGNVVLQRCSCPSVACRTTPLIIEDARHCRRRGLLNSSQGVGVVKGRRRPAPRGRFLTLQLARNCPSTLPHSDYVQFGGFMRVGSGLLELPTCQGSKRTMVRQSLLATIRFRIVKDVAIWKGGRSAQTKNSALDPIVHCHPVEQYLRGIGRSRGTTCSLCSCRGSARSRASIRLGPSRYTGASKRP
jgi:hypothetical protein